MRTEMANTVKSSQLIVALTLGIVWAMGVTGQNAWAQNSFGPVAQPTIGWPVLVSTDTLDNAFAGGLNYPRYNKIDVDGDGRDELVIFDRADRRLGVYTNHGTVGQPKYVYTPGLEQLFPLNVINNLLLLVDYNGDGKKDLFTAGNNEIIVYLNITPAGGSLKWKSAYNPLLTRYDPNSGPASVLYCLQTDIPGLIDVDSDGDLDVLVYNVLGTRIELHKNWGMDSLNRSDTLYLVQASACFGHFAEAYNSGTNSYSIFFNQFCGTEVRAGLGILNTAHGPNAPAQTAHTGGAILPINLNADSLIDLIVSDDGPTSMASVTNGGSRAFAHIVGADSTFPRTDTVVDIPSFPVGFYVDVDEDAVRDLIIAPNSYLGSNDVNDNWYFHNAGADNNPDFRLQTRDFIQHSMLEVGSRAAPHFFDHNGDGLPDLIVGNLSKYRPDGYFRAGLALYHNIGSLAEPVFQLADSNFLGFYTTAGLSGVSLLRPTSADLDADGDLDLVVGAYQKIWYFRNTGTATNPIYTYITDTLGGTVALTQQAEFAPLFTDWDEDNDLDMLCGTLGGTIAYWENTGSTTTPQFTYITHNLGQVTVVDAQNPFSGQATPILMDLRGNNKPVLVVGSASGRVFVYDNVGAPVGSTMNYLGDLFDQPHSRQIAVAAYPYMAVDTVLDSTYHQLVIGTLAGGLLHFNVANPMEGPTAQAEPTSATLPHITVYPNPATGQAKVLAPAGSGLQLISPTGQVVWEGTSASDSHPTAISLVEFANGLYTVVAQTPKGVASQRLWIRAH